MKQELYVSTDVEADGLVPGVNSMLSFGFAVYTKDKKLVFVGYPVSYDFIKIGL